MKIVKSYIATKWFDPGIEYRVVIIYDNCTIFETETYSSYKEAYNVLTYLLQNHVE